MELDTKLKSQPELKLKRVYHLDNNGQLVNYDLVPEDYIAGENETCTPQPEGLYEPITFNGTEWVGVSRDEWLKNQPVPEPLEPSAQDQMIADLTKQLAKATQTATAAQSAVAELTKKVAELKGANE